MREIKNIVLHIFVNKLYQKTGRILTKDVISRLWELSGGKMNRLVYALSQVKNMGILSVLSRDIYMIGDIRDLDEVYWVSIEQIVELHAPSGAIIA